MIGGLGEEKKRNSLGQLVGILLIDAHRHHCRHRPPRPTVNPHENDPDSMMPGSPEENDE